MHVTQRYTLTIHDLFTVTGTDICGAEAEVAILDGTAEVERVKFSGKCQSEGGYSRSYHGRPGLAAKIVKGPGRVAWESVAA